MARHSAVSPSAASVACGRPLNLYQTSLIMRWDIAAWKCCHWLCSLFFLCFVKATREDYPRDERWTVNFRPHHNDHRHWGPFFEESPANASGPPEFSAGGVYALAVPAGGHLHLDCRVAMLHDKTVMWVKKTEERVSLLTVGLTLYSGDTRISLKFQYPNNWRLEITPVQLEDEGLYMCQLSTHPPRVRATNLTVLSPVVVIVDEYGSAVSERYYKEGSRIELQCRGRLSSLEQHLTNLSDTPQWRKDGGDTARLLLKSSIMRSEETEMAISRIVIPSASRSDSGTYSCELPLRGQASVNVHVLQGERQAAVHHESSRSNRLQFATWTFLIIQAFC